MHRHLSLCAVVLIALLLLGTPAQAVATQTLTSPTAGAVVTGPVEVVVTVMPDEGEVIDGVDARLRGSTQRQVPLSFDGQPLEDGSQRWTGTVDPLEGLPLANGTYLLEAQARPLVGDPPGWTGHEIDLRVPPPVRELEATPAEQDPTQVLLSWDSVALPDFIAYRIQRRSDAADGAWTTVLDLTDPRQERATDPVAEPGAYRYRLVVVRANGDGGEVFATSDPRGVRADPQDPGTFTPPRDPDPQPSPSNEPTPGEGGGGVAPITRPTDQPGEGPAPSPTGGTQSSGQPPTGEGSGGRPPRIRVPAQPAPPAPAPAVPFNDGVFEPLLPLEDIPEEITVTQTETAMIDGGSTPGGTLDTFETQRQDKPLFTAIAGGLLLLVSSAHVRRYIADGSSR